MAAVTTKGERWKTSGTHASRLRLGNRTIVCVTRRRREYESITFRNGETRQITVGGGFWLNVFDTARGASLSELDALVPLEKEHVFPETSANAGALDRWIASSRKMVDRYNQEIESAVLLWRGYTGAS